jgi:hypothetical protein
VADPEMMIIGAKTATIPTTMMSTIHRGQ